MPTAYSEDLRWRAVWLNIIKGMTYTEVAEVLFMSEMSVYRYLSQFHASGSVEPKDASGDRNKGLTCLKASLCYNPFCTTQQHTLRKSSRICLIPLAHSTWVHVSTICRTIKQRGFTRKKVQSIALQQSETKRIQFMSEISVYDPDMLIWIDEMGSTRKNSIRSYGYSLRGTRPCTHKLRVSGERLSAIPVITHGIEDVFVCKGSVDGGVFQQFISFSVCVTHNTTV